jgi:hypothetical protein
MGYSPDEQTASVISTAILNGVVAFIVYALFERCRDQKEIYAPRLREKPHRTPKSPTLSLFSWISDINSVSDDETLKMVGLDAFMLLRFLRFCGMVCGICGVFGVCVLFPVYFTAGLHQDGIAGIIDLL